MKPAPAPLEIDPVKMLKAKLSTAIYLGTPWRPILAKWREARSGWGGGVYRRGDGWTYDPRDGWSYTPPNCAAGTCTAP